MTKPTNWGTTYHMPLCASTISCRLKEPANSTVPMSASPMKTSYEIIWAAPRMAPSKEYLLLEAQPPSMMLYAPMDDIDRKKRMPMFRSATMIPGAKGTITKLKKTDTITIAGAMTNTTLSANGGIQSSLKKSFMVSAKTMKTPKGPARLGP